MKFEQTPASSRHSSKAQPESTSQVEAAKTWTLHIILLQSPVWIAAVAAVMQTGVLRQWTDVEYLLFSVSAAAPSVLLPALLPSRPDRGRRPWYEAYHAKLHAWLAVVVAFGTYFGTHYFFDLMGMRYAFAGARWTLGAEVVGTSGQGVPLFLYPLTHAYFATYFAALLVAERAVVGWLRPGSVVRAAVVLALAYAVAFAETFFMASPLLADVFAYDNRERMLGVGSFGYASYFAVGLPMVRRIDGCGKSWGLERVLIEALATCMMIMVSLEMWAKFIGPL